MLCMHTKKPRGNCLTASSSETTLIWSPARAGKTYHQTRSFRASAAHPHVCGENAPNGIKNFADGGSSPRVRGKPGPSAPALNRAGLIPACAGKSTTTQRSQPRSTAHPRMCGENDATDKFQNTLKGSSPRMRGKLPYLNDLMDRGRLIPACAGKTPVVRL